MTEEKRTVELSDFEHRLLLRALSGYRNALIRDQRPTRDINDIIMKVAEAPTKKRFFRSDREAR